MIFWGLLFIYEFGIALNYINGSFAAKSSIPTSIHLRVSIQVKERSNPAY